MNRSKIAYSPRARTIKGSAITGTQRAVGNFQPNIGAVGIPSHVDGRITVKRVSNKR